MTTTPDWEEHSLVLTPILQDNLWKLDDLRTYDPIVWALILHKRTSRAVAEHLGMPHHSVLYELRRYKKAGRVADYQGEKSILWRLVWEEDRELEEYFFKFRKVDRKNEGGY